MEVFGLFLIFGAYLALRILFTDSKSKSDKDAIRYKNGIYALQQKKYAVCHRYFSIAVKHDPKSAVAIACRAKCCFHLGQMHNALTDCNKAIDIDYDLSEVYMLKAEILLDLGDPKAAIVQLDRALWHDESMAEAHKLKGLICQDLGNLTTADYHFEKAINCGCEDSVYYVSRRAATVRKNY